MYKRVYVLGSIDNLCLDESLICSEQVLGLERTAFNFGCSTDLGFERCDEDYPITTVAKSSLTFRRMSTNILMDAHSTHRAKSSSVLDLDVFRASKKACVTHLDIKSSRFF